MPIKIKISKKPLEHFQPSKYCEWCVNVRADNPNELRHPDDDVGLSVLWALDFSADTDILDPDIADTIEGAPGYTVDPGAGEGTVTRPGDTEFTICFVAACAERAGTEMSLEQSIDMAASGFGVSTWRPVPFKGAPDGKRPIIGPAPVAMAPVEDPSEFGILASFEARKLAALMGVDATRIQASVVGSAKSDLSGRVMYVSGVSEKPSLARKTRQQKIK